MLNAAARLKKKRVEPVATSSTDAVMDDRARILAVAHDARTRLQDLADLDDLTCFLFKPAIKVIVKLGVTDGIGLMLRAARFGFGGLLTDAEIQRFDHEVVDTIESMSASVLNYSVILSLLLTIYVTLGVLHVGTGPYAGGDDAALRLDAFGAAGDAASYLSPADPQSFRFGFYVAECVLIMLGTNVCFAGLLRALAVYNAITVELPSAVARCEYILAKPTRVSAIKDGTQIGLICLASAVPCILVRSSAVAFLCAVGMWAYIFCWWLHYMCLGELLDIVVAQHREARSLLAAAARARAERGAPGCSA